jgi:cephalosporin-C deacetylase-like acetyl esterase
MKNKIILNTFLLLIIAHIMIACGGKKEIPVVNYYDYDAGFPLQDSVRLIDNNNSYLQYYVNYLSVHDKRVTALLAIPKNVKKPMPVIILLHGLGDRKTVDYIETGNKAFIDSGYAVFRIDIDNHGERRVHDYEFNFNDGYRFSTRDVISQTVFDLRRAVDFLGTRKEIDTTRIGYFGISLGGVIGTIFCGVDNRVKVPVIALAGGNLHLAFGMEAFTDEAKNYFSIIDPINFVALISPRPLLMINAENDEIIPPITSKLMYKAAGEPKRIIWYPTKHRKIPINKAYLEGVLWYKKYL